MISSRTPRVPVAVLLLVLTLPAGSTLQAQVTDADGLIRSPHWLILGPFKQGVGCGATDDDLLGNFIAPSSIACQYPREGEEIDYDPFVARSIDYLGPRSPDSLPFWRPFNDGTDDGDNDLTRDLGQNCVDARDRDCENVVSWLVTYVEYTGPAPLEVDLCAGFDDGGQIWLDNRMVFNRAGCRRREKCQETVPVLVTPGVHRIAVASFARGIQWGLSLGLARGGQPILDSSPDWNFFGGRRPAFSEPTCPPLSEPVDLRVCEVADDNGVQLDWKNPPGARAEQPISVSIDGVEVRALPGDATSVKIPATEIPDLGGVTVCLSNASGVSACCEVVVLEPVLFESCRRNVAGGMDLSWSNPPNARREQRISIQVNDVEVAGVAGDATAATIPAAQLPAGDFTICVVNPGGVPVCCRPVATDESGRITTRNWLVLGPFNQRLGCDGRDLDDQLLLNYIAPTEIECQYPREGDTIVYDFVVAASFGYAGPFGATGFSPTWRALDDGTPDDGDLDLTNDRGRVESEEGVMSWLATYIEYLGADPIDVTLCIGVDDSAQVWLDETLVFSKYECGSRGLCDHLVPVTVTPGAHRIALAVFNADSAWGGSLALQRDGVPITGDPALWPDWVFHGKFRPDVNFPCPTGLPEICDNGVDDDGDGESDCDDSDCAAHAGCRQSVFIRGDCSGDGAVTGQVGDAIFLLNYNFLGGLTPPCMAACDADGNGSVTGQVGDAIYLLNFNFLGGPPPEPPFPGCGKGLLPGDAVLGCEKPTTRCP